MKVVPMMKLGPRRLEMVMGVIHELCQRMPSLHADFHLLWAENVLLCPHYSHRPLDPARLHV
jgi:hypothetical protein